jgi:hypothetical protein
MIIQIKSNSHSGEQEVIMKHLLVLFLCAGLLFFAGCKNLTTPEDPPPVIPACEQNNTATITFENRSVNNYSMDVMWDGVRITTLGPWQKSDVFTVSAGQHTMAFKISNSSRLACTIAYPVLVRCTAYAYFCTG